MSKQRRIKGKTGTYQNKTTLFLLFFYYHCIKATASVDNDTGNSAWLE